MVKPIAALCAAILALAPWAHAQPTEVPASGPCATGAHRALDFWVGDWLVARADTGAPAGRSHIALHDGGCVIAERYVTVNGAYSGQSLNMFDGTQGHWVQFWMDSTGDLTRFTGAATANGMRFEAPDDATPGERKLRQYRMTLTRLDAGRVQQTGEVMQPDGSWRALYDLIYTPIGDD